MNKNKITKQQNKDTGIVFGLIMLFFGITLSSTFWLKLSFIIILSAQIMPDVFYYSAVVWFGFSEKLGGFVSKLVLALIYILIVLPVSLLRRLLKKDSMFLNDFKKGRTSSWIVRNHEYSKNDIQKPY